MKKIIKNTLQYNIGILIIFTVIISLASWFYMAITSPKDIQNKYDGIKYQAGNQDSTEPVSIEIKGKYRKEIFTGNVEFMGTLKIGEKIFDESTIKFNKYNMSLLDSSEGNYRVIFIGDLFKKLTIEIQEPNQNGGYTWNSENGWLISAPCKDRKEAVKISNELIQKFYKDLAIK